MNKIQDFCFCESRTNSKNEFVGIRFEKGETKIQFPLGYFKNNEEIKSLSDDVLRESILNLFSVLSDSELLKNVRPDSSVALNSLDYETVEFPMQAYLNVIRNFLDFGYIKEKEEELKKGKFGKIHWGKTIKYVHPVISENKKDLIYLDLISRKINYSENSLITLVHQFCVHDAISKLGFLFGLEPTEIPVLGFDYILFSSVIHSKLSRTYVNQQLLLLSDLAKIVEYLAEHKTEDGIDKDFYFGVNKFHPVWEALVDSVFSSLPNSFKKEDFNPSYSYENRERDKLRPDTICIYNENCFVIDSKYYKFGISGKEEDLPRSNSICKQMAYAEFIENKFKDEFSSIYNVFVLPYNKDFIPKNNSWKINSNISMVKAGTLCANWKSENYAYRNIHCILLDVSSLMRNYQNSSFAINLKHSLQSFLKNP